MLAIQILLLVLLLVVVPTMAGGIFDSEETGLHKLLFMWVSGQMLLLAGFQLICVPLILSPREDNFRHVIILYGVYAVAAVLLSMGVSIRRQAVRRTIVAEVFAPEADLAAGVLRIFVLALLVLQQVLAGIMAYEEGDDAFYVAVSSITAESGTMYEILPYTGGTTGLDVRHGLAPFPVWVATISRLTGIHAATIAQIVLPVVLIAMAYAVYALIGRRLFKENRRGQLLFLLLLELLVIFGGQSFYTAENFLLVRTAQGKAVLANIVIPFTFLLLFLLFEKLEQGRMPEIRYWLLLGMTMITGCLCSTLGTMIVCLLLAVGGGCAVLCYKRWKILPLLAACGGVPLAMALLYLRFD